MIVFLLSSANTDQIDKAKEIVKKLKFTFVTDSFENPALQTHYANVEAMALDRDAPEDITDFTRTYSPSIQVIEVKLDIIVHFHVPCIRFFMLVSNIF